MTEQIKKKRVSLLVGVALLFAAACLYAVGTRSSMPPNMLRNYQIKLAEHAFIPGTKDLLVVIGFEAKDLNGRTNPKSLLAVYRVDDEGAQLIYRFSPVLPKEIGYPRQLLIESAKITWDKQKGLSIFTCWGETGADYWGTHPILFSFKRGKPYPVTFYGGNLSDNPRILGISWTKKDFTAKNHYDGSESVKTILTQGASIFPNGTIELVFWGDEAPKAAYHRLVKLKINPSWL